MTRHRTSVSTKKRGADFSDCACTGAHLPKLVHATTLALLARGPMHGYALTEAMAGLGIFGECPPDHSGIYRLLRSMERRSLVKTRTSQTRSGRQRCVYALSENGQRCLSRWAESLAEYAAAVNSVLRLCRTGGASPKTRS